MMTRIAVFETEEQKQAYDAILAALDKIKVAFNVVESDSELTYNVMLEVKKAIDSEDSRRLPA